MINKKIRELKIKDRKNNNDLYERYNRWIANISVENKSIFEQIFCDIEYYSEKDVRKLLQKLYNSIEQDEKFIDNTLILFIESQDSKFNSSHVMTSFLIESNNLAKNLCTLADIRDKKYNPENIILCDDFIGSGKTVIDFIDNNIDILYDKHIYLICIHCMEEGLTKIQNFTEDKNINITILYYMSKDKYLSDSNPTLLENYLKECAHLNVSEPLGNFNSEALVVTYRNTPNNTLSAVWQDTNINKAIFPRVKTHTPECRRMREEKKVRRIERYINGRKD